MKPRIVLVDDEAAVVQGLALLLGKRFEVVTAVGGVAALEILERDRAFMVIVTDMRMPVMDGVMLLARARLLVPAASRILLTGYSDMDSVAKAVNDGLVFRFLMKPCPAPALIKALEAGVLHSQQLSGRAA